MLHLSDVITLKSIAIWRRLQSASLRTVHKGRATNPTSLTCAFLFLALFILPTAANALCLPHLITYLKLDEASNSVFADESPNGINGSCTTCPTVAANDLIGNARLFSAVSGSTITIPYNSKMNWAAGHDFAVEFWVRHGAGAPAAFETVIGRLDGATQLQWQIGMDTGGSIVARFIAEDGSGAAAGVAGAALNDNVWHHIAFVHSAGAGENRLYVDGQLSDTSAAAYTAGFTSATAGITIGGLNGSAYFNGWIDEVAVYNSVLTGGQILQHYNDGRVGIQAGYCGPAGDIRIMPLGDSITRGRTASIADRALTVGYRQELYLNLLDDGGDGLVDYYFDFVGSINLDGTNATPAFDIDHEGVGGETASEIASRALATLPSYPADVVLLHAGTNDMLNATPISTVVADVETILDNIWSREPDAMVILARIINQQPTDSATTAFNAALQTMADARIAAGDRLVVVDMESALTLPSDWDGDTPNVHPSPQGYLKMAARWYSALTDVLPPSNEAVPLIISDGSTKNAIVGQLFTFQVESDGNPLPTYSLTTTPAPGATIGTTSGLFQWTPTAAGLYDVSVRAVNANGADTFSFQINASTTPPPPPPDPVPPSDGGGSGGGCFISTITR